MRCACALVLVEGDQLFVHLDTREGKNNFQQMDTHHFLV